MNYKKWLFSGIAIFIGSILIAAAGTFWGIYSSFDALGKAENIGIAPIGNSIQNAFIFTVIGVAGSATGIVLIAIGGLKAYLNSKSKTILPEG